MYINPNNKIHDPNNTNTDLIEVLHKLGKPRIIKKGETILSEGDNVDFVFIVEKGCFRTYRWIEEEEVTIGFSFEGDIDTCPYAFINKTKSSDTIETLVDSKVIKIHLHQIELLKKENSQMNEFIQALLSQYIEILINRNIDLRTKNADILYSDLLKRQPQEVAKIPLMYIASYLGISKERLSRIRKKLNHLT